jgi:hypothetical protein
MAYLCSLEPEMGSSASREAVRISDFPHRLPDFVPFIPRKPAQPARTGGAGLRLLVFSCQFTQILSLFRPFAGRRLPEPVIHSSEPVSSCVLSWNGQIS